MAFPLEAATTVHRIARMRHPFLDGQGAAIYGGRWNSKGRPVVYTAASFALATLEYLVNASTLETPVGYGRVEVHLPAGVLAEQISDYANPEVMSDEREWTQEIGDRWLDKNAALILVVPSAVVAGIESNLLVNPSHPDFSLLRSTAPVPVVWDSRLFRKQVTT